ncbi:hypothetical protein LB554_15240 [Mesorhizobium sp. CO1-1-11]|uniref:hypothetical protein n=1 Tax=Mesorhizobium sp. CO1-1-11 TaxID=2876636 RepID=UPI001CCE68B1|nr:hypothetical protein [Mesorhizobium sp. CO1-1-11]MBZ9725305.1 hypothetical protein [Mesorhizobium sp. CO1-1-11]
MPKGAIRLFDPVVAEFVEEGFLAEPWDWGEWFNNEFYCLYELETQKCSPIVSWLATDCYAEIIKGYGPLKADYFVEALAKAVLPVGALEITREARSTKTRSTISFEAEFGLRVAVDITN